MAVVTVRDALAEPVLKAADPEVVAGSGGLDKPVRWVHSAELADIAPLLRAGDLLLSTGIAMPDSDDGLAQFASSLADSGASGLVIELGRRWQRVPHALVAACDETDLPLVALAREVRFAAVAQAVGERIVDEQLAALRDTQRVHEAFTELSIAEAGPRDILEAVQRLAGAPVVLESARHRVVDYRAGAEDMDAFLHDWNTRSRATRLEERTAWDETNGWLVTRVGKRARRWGRLIVASRQPPTERLVAIAERAAAALALHRLHDRQRDSQVRRAHHELLVGLLADPGSADLVRRCELAGFPTRQRQFVGVTLQPRITRAVHTTDERPVLDEVLAATVQAVEEQRLPALVCAMDQAVRLLVSLGNGSNARRVVDDLVGRVARRHDVTAGAGRPVARLADTDRTLREAHHVVQSVRPGGHDALVNRLQDVHLRGLLAMLVDDDRLRLFAERELGPLRAHDEDSGSELVAAVHALLTHPTSKSAAAASLHVSRPVLYDRLRKAEGVLGVDLDDPDIRVSLHVALLADEIAARAATP